MKKVYITPSVEILKFNVNNVILTGSVSGAGAGEDIDYGGIDDGTHDPDVKGDKYDWDW